MSTPITIIGNVTRDPELRFTTGGKAVASFSVAVSEYKGQDQEPATSFYNVTAWEGLAENVAATLATGMRVIVTGRLEMRKWEKDDKSGLSPDVTAEAIGPDLRWATAEVSKVEKGEKSSGAAKPKRAPKQDTIYGDEEPF